MPDFEITVTCRAPAEELWALLYDPARFTEWWTGTKCVEATADGGLGRVSTAFPDRVVPFVVREPAGGSRVTVSCLEFDVDWRWTLAPAGHGCRVTLHVHIPDEHAALVPCQHEDMADSVHRLVALAEDEAGIAASA